MYCSGKASTKTKTKTTNQVNTTKTTKLLHQRHRPSRSVTTSPIPQPPPTPSSIFLESSLSSMASTTTITQGNSQPHPNNIGPQTASFISTFLPPLSLQHATIPATITINTAPQSSSSTTSTTNGASIDIGLTNSHKSHYKGQNGRLVIFGGSECFSGAPYFAAKSATTIGGELSQIISEPTAVHSLRSLNPDNMVAGLLPSCNNIPHLNSIDVVVNDSDDNQPHPHRYHQSNGLLFNPVLLQSKLGVFSQGMSNDLQQQPLQFLPDIISNPKNHPQLAIALEQSGNAAMTMAKLSPYRIIDDHQTHIIENGVGNNNNHHYNHLLSWLRLRPAPKSPTWHNTPIAYLSGPGLGQDPLTLTFLAEVLGTGLLTTHNLFILDADALALFKSTEFTTKVMLRGLGRLGNGREFNNTILTPNHYELDTLYRNLCSHLVPSSQTTASSSSQSSPLHQQQLNHGEQEQDEINFQTMTIQSNDKTLTIIPLPAQNTTKLWTPDTQDKLNWLYQNAKLSTGILDGWDGQGEIPHFQLPLYLNNSAGTFNNIPNQSQPPSWFSFNRFNLVSRQDTSTPTPVQPPTTVNDNININKAIAISRYLNGTTVFLKGERDVITNGSHLVIMAMNETSPSRCGGQGDILGGLIGGYSCLVGQWWNRTSHPTTTTTSQPDLAMQLYDAKLSPTLISSILASYSLKLAAVQSFQKHYTGSRADRIIDEIPLVTRALKMVANEQQEQPH